MNLDAAKAAKLKDVELEQIKKLMKKPVGGHPIVSWHTYSLAKRTAGSQLVNMDVGLKL